ncbi:hypothetical protein CHRY9390_01908 [Chryseobacterium aquaeductus]|uniref:Uncharacterized protein n=1 Tax=Chryseobacterium aquaeductus TaxID=2675056 RepID=A0A9N8MI71_9FLAO|nr:hypothetical protein [Chryseobacterium aquaeductus]CAA7331221.1 hypothetical protein CHRY9390_01908 [Chryseobacterium potabilaquae]CAD7808904.1 hypothetical protein CHRY9390_01908 [Chryseobacterium aquaeductus]
MKIWIFSALLCLIISCKKESMVAGIQHKDTIAVTEKPVKDSLTLQQKQPEIYAFVTELCNNKGYYDSAKYSRDEIDGTYKLWFRWSASSLSTPSVFDLKDLREIRRDKDKILAKLDGDFIERKKELENLKIVNVPYWQNIKKMHYQELLQDYEKKKIQIEAYSNPAVLLNNTFTKNCQNFAKALNSNDTDQIAEWKKLRITMSKANGNPQNVMGIFENHLQSTDWKEYATIDLITFGWGNSANADVRRPSHDEKMNREFESLFIKIDSECDEP